MGWINSAGKAAPVETGMQEDGKKKAEELYEVAQARQEMKPILLFFAKARDVLKFGQKTKDRQVETSATFEKEIFGRLSITKLAGEFVNIKVDVSKADRKILGRTYFVRRAPVIVILDLFGKVIYRLSSPKLNYRQMGKIMETALKRVEKDVHRLAKSDEDTLLVQRAKARSAALQMRDKVDKGLALTYDRKWALAEKLFSEVLARKEENEYKKNAGAAMKELEAGRLFTKGERAYKKKQYRGAKELLDKAIQIRESRYYKQLATELLRKVNKKLS